MKRILRTSAIALLMLMVGGASALAAPATTSPATALSPANMAGQNLQSVLAQAYQAQQNAVDQLEQARLRQVLALIKARQSAEVEFAGTLQQTGAAGQWAVAGLVLRQTSATVFEGAPAAGLHAHVRAQIHNDGTLEALHVRTMTQSGAVLAQHHAAQWLRDDHGIHLGESHHTSADNHAADHQPATGPQHAMEPEHTGPAAGRQQQPAPQSTHHPETPAQHPAQPQPPAPQQPAHHGEESSHGGHSSGHD